MGVDAKVVEEKLEEREEEEKEVEDEEEEAEEENNCDKSNNPHLAGGEKTSIATNTSWILWRLHGVVHVASLRGANQKQQQWKRRWSEHDQPRRPLSLSLSAILRMLTNTLTVCHMTRTNWALSTAKPNICHDVFSKSMFNIRHMMHQGVWEPYLVCR